MAIDFHMIVVFGYIPFDIVRPVSICCSATADTVIVCKPFNPSSDIRWYLCVLSVVAGLRNYREYKNCNCAQHSTIHWHSPQVCRPGVAQKQSDLAKISTPHCAVCGAVTDP